MRQVPADVENSTSETGTTRSPKPADAAAPGLRARIHARPNRDATRWHRASHVSLSLPTSLAAIRGAAVGGAHSRRPTGLAGRWPLVPVRGDSVGVVSHSGKTVSRTARRLPRSGVAPWERNGHALAGRFRHHPCQHHDARSSTRRRQFARDATTGPSPWVDAPALSLPPAPQAPSTPAWPAICATRRARSRRNRSLDARDSRTPRGPGLTACHPTPSPALARRLRDTAHPVDGARVPAPTTVLPLISRPARPWTASNNKHGGIHGPPHSRNVPAQSSWIESRRRPDLGNRVRSNTSTTDL
jgi:hypothetical protein